MKKKNNKDGDVVVDNRSSILSSSPSKISDKQSTLNEKSAKTPNERLDDRMPDNKELPAVESNDIPECSSFSCCRNSCKAFMLAFCISCIICYLAADKIMSSYVTSQQIKLQPHLNSLAELAAQQATSIKELETQVSDLQQKLAMASNLHNGTQCTRRDKWLAWVALRHKLENNENCKDELEHFNRIFTNDKVLLDMVQELVRGVDCVSNSNESNDQNLCNRLLRQVVRFKKINQSKLAEVSGYVLSNTD